MDSFCFPYLFLGGRKKYEPLLASEMEVSTAFSFKELSAATRKFRKENLVGRVDACLYKGFLTSVKQVVAIKIQVDADRNESWSTSSSREDFLAHVQMLSRLRHPNVLDFLGYWADGDHRILVHEFMPLGSLQDHLHVMYAKVLFSARSFFGVHSWLTRSAGLHRSSDPSSPDKAARLDWDTRMKIAAGVAKGLGYLHECGVVYLGMTCSNILLGDGYHPKLSEPGMKELGRPLVNRRLPTRVIPGYLPLETVRFGQLSVPSDVYNFGVVLLVLITGRRPFDRSPAATGRRYLAKWARPLLQDRREFAGMVDPALEGRYDLTGLNRAMALVSTCIRKNRAKRPSMGTVLEALAHIADSPAEPLGALTS